MTLILIAFFRPIVQLYLAHAAGCRVALLLMHPPRTLTAAEPRGSHGGQFLLVVRGTLPTIILNRKFPRVENLVIIVHKHLNIWPTWQTSQQNNGKNYN